MAVIFVVERYLEHVVPKALSVMESVLTEEALMISNAVVPGVELVLPAQHCVR